MDARRLASWVVLPIAIGAVVFTIALPGGRTPGGNAPRQPLAADVWPGFEPQPVAIGDLCGLMLKLAVERRDEPLEMRLEDSQGRGFDWPIGDLYAGLDQHWVGLLEAGDWRISIRRRGTARSLAQRRFSLAAGMAHGLALDLRSGLGDREEPHVVRLDIDFGALAPDVVAHVAALDEIFEARRAGSPEPEGMLVELERTAGGTRLAGTMELAVGEHVLVLEPLGFEHVFHVAGGVEPPLVLTLRELELLPSFVGAEDEALPAGTRVAWSSALAPGAPAILWRAPQLTLGDDAVALRTTGGELRAAVALPGRKPIGVRAAAPQDGGPFEVTTVPRKRAR